MPGERYDVRMAQPAIGAFEALDPPRKAAVARAIRRVGTDTAVPFEVPASLGASYKVVIPEDDADAPVVVYRERPKLEGGGYLITGLLGRHAYNALTETSAPSLLDRSAWQKILDLSAVTSAIGIGLGSRAAGARLFK